jgi:localization factor PodJL
LAPAEYRLGSAYEKGIGVTRDTALAMAWYGRAAEAGNIRAMHNLAVMAAEGAAGKPDYARAAGWFQKAAALGVRDSQFNLAILYARGLGIEQNLSQSYTWFSVAATQGDDDAAKKRDEVAARLDAKTLAAAKAVADNFHPQTADAVANEVAAPPGGWDAVAPPRSVPAGAKASPRVSTM